MDVYKYNAIKVPDSAIEQTDSEQETLHKLRCQILSCKIAKALYRFNR